MVKSLCAVFKNCLRRTEAKNLIRNLVIPVDSCQSFPGSLRSLRKQRHGKRPSKSLPRRKTKDRSARRSRMATNSNKQNWNLHSPKSKRTLLLSRRRPRQPKHPTHHPPSHPPPRTQQDSRHFSQNKPPLGRRDHLPGSKEDSHC